MGQKTSRVVPATTSAKASLESQPQGDRAKTLEFSLAEWFSARFAERPIRRNFSPLPRRRLRTFRQSGCRTLTDDCRGRPKRSIFHLASRFFVLAENDWVADEFPKNMSQRKKPWRSFLENVGTAGWRKSTFSEISYVSRARQNSSISSSVRPFVSGTRK
jgi:hypothetical protein